MLSEFERRAWDNRKSSEKHKPEMALKIVLDDIERGLNAKHVAIVVIEDVEGGDRVHLYNAGDQSELAVEGALMRAIAIQARSE
jgi:hypothetical protein